MTRKAPYDLLRVGLALLVTAIAGVGHFALPLDVGNASMRSRDSAAAATTQRRDREFGHESTVLAMLEPRGEVVSGDPTDRDVAKWLEALRDLPGVERLRTLPVSGPAATVVAFEVQGEAAAVEIAAGRVREISPPTHRLSVTGQALGELAIARALDKEQDLVIPSILATLGLVLFLIYRRPSLVLAALLPGLGSILWLGGLRYVLGHAIDPVSALLAPVVLIVGVAGAVHVIERHLDLLRQGVPFRDAPARAVRSLAVPLLLTASTTVAGFLVLTARSIPAVRSFGVLAALGVLLALFWTIAVIPPWLRLTTPRREHPPSARRADYAASFMARLGPLSPWIVGATALAALFLTLRGLEVQVDTEPLRILPEQHSFRVQTERIANRAGGIETFELLLPTPHPTSVAEHAELLIHTLTEEPMVQSMLGVPRQSAEGTLLLGALLRPGGTAAREALFARVEEEATRIGFRDARVTGPAVLVARDSETLVREQRQGIVAVLVLLGILMSVGFRSWRLGLLGLLPNVLPCIALYGGLALADRPLSVPTTMIATVLLGLIVDDTIHFLHGFGEERRAGRTTSEAIAGSLARCGRPILITSAVLALGFAAGLVGRLTTTTEFATLCSLTILVALACDLVILPALLLVRVRRPRTQTHPLELPAESCAKITT